MVQGVTVSVDSSDGIQTDDLPVALKVENVLGCKWTIRLLQLVADGCTRPSAILRACPGLSAKVMNERWRMMIQFGIVHRTVFGDRPPIQVEYVLTAFGRRFMGILEEVRRLQEDVDGEILRSATERHREGA